MSPQDVPFFQHAGWCPVCEQDTVFTATGPYFRSTLRCPHCNSPPRERALMHVIAKLYPNWRSLAIHESSPLPGRQLSGKLEKAPGYVSSQYDPSVPWGERHPTRGFRSENLEAQTFADASFDLVITQDVFEHVFSPDKAIKEIARTLRHGGAHICTFPMVRRSQPSIRRAGIKDGQVVHLLPEEYHGDPVTGKALVTIDYGYDVTGFLAHHSGLSVWIWSVDMIDHGIRADLNEVVVCQKFPVPELAAP